MKREMKSAFYLFVIAGWLAVAVIMPLLHYNPAIWVMYCVPLIVGFMVRKQRTQSSVLFTLSAMTPVVELLWGFIDGANLFGFNKAFYCFDVYGISGYSIFSLIIPGYVFMISFYTFPKSGGFTGPRSGGSQRQ
jgi:hypothetical protein